MSKMETLYTTIQSTGSFVDLENAQLIDPVTFDNE